jgi:hypothetical protein
MMVDGIMFIYLFFSAFGLFSVTGKPKSFGQKGEKDLKRQKIKIKIKNHK